MEANEAHTLGTGDTNGTSVFTSVCVTERVCCVLCLCGACLLPPSVASPLQKVLKQPDRKQQQQTSLWKVTTAHSTTYRTKILSDMFSVFSCISLCSRSNWKIR